MSYREGLLRYGWPAKPREAACHFRLAIWPDHAVAVVSQVDDNPGVSTTNAIEVVAARLAEEFGISPECLTLFEHFRRWEPLGDDTFSRIEWGHPSRMDLPVWNITTRTEVEQALGRPLQYPNNDSDYTMAWVLNQVPGAMVVQ